MLEKFTSLEVEINKQFSIRSTQIYVVLQRCYVQLVSEYYGEGISYFTDENGHLREYEAINSCIYQTSLEQTKVKSFRQSWQIGNQVKHSLDAIPFDEDQVKMHLSTFNNIAFELLQEKDLIVLKSNDREDFEKDIPVIENNQVNKAIRRINYERDNWFICPDCGGDLVIKHNSQTGKPFYGCSNYRTLGCRRTYEVWEKDKALFDKTFGSVYFTARQRDTQCKTKFIQSIAVPKRLLDSFYSNNELNISDLYPYSHWRMDYIPSVNKHSSKVKSLLALASKILTRGRITVPSPSLETKICVKERLYSNIDFDMFEGIYHETVDHKFWLDSERYEQEFFFSCLKQAMGNGFYNYVIPQVELSSLVDVEEDLGNQRVDFVINDNFNKMVIEIDDSTHKSTAEKDKARDELLTAKGFEVKRISSDEIIKKNGPVLSNLITRLSAYNKKFNYTEEDIELIKIKIAHQLQIAIINAISVGKCSFNSSISVDLNSSVIKDKDKFCQLVIEDLNELLNNIAILCKTTTTSELRYSKNRVNSFHISYKQDEIPDNNTLIITDVVYNQDFVNVQPDYSICEYDTNQENLTYFLNYLFRHKSFRNADNGNEQYKAIKNAMLGNDTMVLLPTGYGKSVAFQLTGLLSQGITFVVSPLLSLMDDQIDNLKRIGIDRVTKISSDETYIEKNKIQNVIVQGDYNIVYLSPERLQIDRFRNVLKATVSDIPIPVFAIDEAHCLSEWGHDFRTAYLNIGRIIRECCKYRNVPPTIMALTGTASESVLKDIKIQLNIDGRKNIIKPRQFNREELNYSIVSCSVGSKFDCIKDIIASLPGKFNVSKQEFLKTNVSNAYSGIVFCPHVNGDYGVWRVYNEFLQNGFSATLYSGKKPEAAPQSRDWNEVKKENASKFKNNEVSILVGTSAYGMGIDKSNVRYTIHYNMPNSVEALYQETGRAGRDGQQAYCTIVTSFNDKSMKRFDSEYEPPTNKTEDDDDLDRMLYFHGVAFRGITFELEVIKKVLEKIEKECKDKPNTININFINICEDKLSNISDTDIEKAVYRLLQLGVIKDYTKNSKYEFIINLPKIDTETIINKYLSVISNYSEGRVNSESVKVAALTNSDASNEFITNVAKLLLEFNYDVIERGRKQQLRSLFSILIEAATIEDESAQNTLIKDRVSSLLGNSEEALINEILSSSNDAFEKIIKVIEEADNERIDDILAEATRALESTPDHPGLLALSTIDSLSYSTTLFDDFKSDLLNVIDSATVKYSIDKTKTSRFIGWVLGKVHSKIITKFGDDEYDEIVDEILNNEDCDYVEVMDSILDTHGECEAVKPFLTKYLIDSSNTIINKLKRKE